MNGCFTSDPATGAVITYDHDVPFYKGQTRLVFSDNGRIDPTSIQDYIARGGYSAASKALFSMTPDQVVDEVEKAGLRGRGGAGFPTGKKWRFTRSSPGTVKYIVCNADEGDPGAFMDRSVLEGNPHLVLEGMIVAAYAIGAQQGYLYVRAEYPLAVEHLRQAIRDAEEHGLLGDNILGSGFNCRLKIKEGAGAFVCGEETALLASIEGKRGMPRTRPPFPAVAGLWGKPTNINNVETYANVRSIILGGSAAYAAIGTEEARAPRYSPSRERSITRDSSKSPWARRCARSSTRSAAASRGDGSSRRRRWEVRPAAVFPLSISICPSITNPLPKPAR